MSDGNDRCAQCDCARAEHGECPKCAGHAFAEPLARDDDMVTVTDVFNSDRKLVRQTVTFDVTNHHVAAYCEDCSHPPDILRGEAVFLQPDGPIPYSLAKGRYLDSQIWGYIVGYDSATRRLEVAPKR